MMNLKKQLALILAALCLTAAALPAGALRPIPTIPPRITPEPPAPAASATPTLAGKAATLVVGDIVTFGH